MYFFILLYLNKEIYYFFCFVTILQLLKIYILEYLKKINGTHASDKDYETHSKLLNIILK